MSEAISEIVSGPSRDELVESLRSWNDGRPAFIQFWVKVRYAPDKIRDHAVRAEIKKIGPQDGSYQVWRILLHTPGSSIGSKYLDGYYDSLKRTGRVRLVASVVW